MTVKREDLSQEDSKLLHQVLEKQFRGKGESDLILQLSEQGAEYLLDFENRILAEERK